MPPGCHHYEIGVAFVRCSKNLSLYVPLFVDLSPMPCLTGGHYDLWKAILFTDVKQGECHPAAFERVCE